MIPLNFNFIDFFNILESCRNHYIKKLTFASSSSVYGLNKSLPFKTSDYTDHPVSLYGTTKKSNEIMAHAYSHLYGINITGLRFFTVYGPWGRPDMAPMLFTDAILNNKPIKVFNHGNMIRDFTYIDDIVKGIIKVIDNPAQSNPEWDAKDPTPESSFAPFKIYNIGNSTPVKLMDFIKEIENALGKKAKKEFMPMQPGDVLSTFADTTILEHRLGYKPTTELNYGVNEFIRWYKKYRK